MVRKIREVERKLRKKRRPAGSPFFIYVAFLCFVLYSLFFKKKGGPQGRPLYSLLSTLLSLI